MKEWFTRWMESGVPERKSSSGSHVGMTSGRENIGLVGGRDSGLIGGRDRGLAGGRNIAKEQE